MDDREIGAEDKRKSSYSWAQWKAMLTKDTAHVISLKLQISTISYNP